MSSPTSECAQLSLLRVVHAYTFVPPMQIVLLADRDNWPFSAQSDPREHVNYRITIETKPSHALFEVGSIHTHTHTHDVSLCHNVSPQIKCLTHRATLYIWRSSITSISKYRRPLYFRELCVTRQERQIGR